MATISEVIERLINHNGTLMILLGAGASREGIRSDGSPVPGFFEIQNEFLKQRGYTPRTEEEIKEKFFELVKTHEYQLMELVRDMLGDTHPNKAHVQFISFCLARVRENRGRSTVIITTNYDSLAEDAYKAIALAKEYVRPFSLIQREAHKHGLDEAKGHMNQGRIIVLHLWGDLDYARPAFLEEQMTLSPNVRKFLLELAQSPILSIGYSFSDKPLLNIINQKADHPVFVVDSKLNIPEVARQRQFILLKEYFGRFMQKTHDHITSESKIKDSYLNYLSGFNPVRNLTIKGELKNKVKLISNLPMERLRKKLPKGGKKTLIPRQKIESAIYDFLSSESKILAIIGEAGMGKSTVAYMLSENFAKSGKVLILTLDPGYFSPTHSFSEMLSRDLGFQGYQLLASLAALDAYLSKENLQLLIVIDALNELPGQQPYLLKNELEHLATISALENRIKFIYTCRKVYWDNVLNGEPIGDIYYLNNIQLLSKFTDAEASGAFENYKNEYNLIGKWSELDTAFRETLSDPLMMHMMARAYEGGAIPQFAPAVSVFNTYLKQLDKKEGLNKFSYEEAIIEIGKKFLAGNHGYSLDKKIFNYDHDFAVVFSQGEKDIRHAYRVLEDERILFSFNRRYSFVYERFFEYALGRALIDREELQYGYDSHKIQALYMTKDASFTYKQGLKSAIVNLSCNSGLETQESNLLLDQSRLSSLLNNKEENIRTFIHYCIQEILGESKKAEDFYFIECAFDTRVNFLSFIVNYCSDNLHASKYFIEGAFANQEHWIENAREGIKKAYLATSKRPHIEGLIELFLRNKINTLSADELVGLFFILSIYFEPDINSQDAGYDAVKMIRRIIRELPGQISIKNKLKKSLYIATVKYIDRFFSQDDRHVNLKYFWEMPDEVRREALKFPTLFRKAIQGDSFGINDFEVLRFFCSDCKNFNDIYNLKDQAEIQPYSYRIEHILARYCILLIAKIDFNEGMRVFRYFVKSRFWFSIDAALCLAQRVAIRNIECGEKIRAKEILDEMKHWTEEFAKEQPDLFFRSLYAKNPLQETYNPMNQVAMVEGKLYSYNQTIPYLFKGIDEVIKSQQKGEPLRQEDLNFARLSVLSMRKLVRYFPDAVMLAIKEAIKIEDNLIQSWSRDTLINLFLYFPKKVSHNLQEWNEVERLKNITEVAKIQKPDIAGMEWDYDKIANYFLLDSPKSRLEIFLSWYERLFESYDLESYLNDLGDEFFRMV